VQRHAEGATCRSEWIREPRNGQAAEPRKDAGAAGLVATGVGTEAEFDRVLIKPASHDGGSEGIRRVVASGGR